MSRCKPNGFGLALAVKDFRERNFVLIVWDSESSPCANKNELFQKNMRICKGDQRKFDGSEGFSLEDRRYYPFAYEGLAQQIRELINDGITFTVLPSISRRIPGRIRLLTTDELEEAKK